MTDAMIPARARGALLAAAVGDAMGWPQEDRSHRVRDGGEASRTAAPAFCEWKRRVGSRFQPAQETVGRGEYSDDTQLLLATSRALLSGPEWWQNLAKVELPTWLLYERGGGRATKNAAEAWLFGREPWKQSKIERRASYFNAGGNGAAMRVLPHALWGASNGAFDSIGRSALADGILTHGHPRALVGALSYVYAAWWATRHSGTLAYGALVDAVLTAVECWSKPPMVDDLAPTWAESAQGDKGKTYERTWADTVAEMTQLLRTAKEGMTQGSLAVDRQVMAALGCFGAAVKGSGTIASATAIFLASRYASDPLKGVTEAAFAIGADTDTLASMTGGLLGLLCGEEWLEGQASDVQDARQIREVADLIAVGEVVVPIAERYRRAIPVTSAKTNETLVALVQAREGTTICLPDDRAARVISKTELSAGLKGHVGFLWKLSTSDGQTVHIRKFRSAQAALPRSAPSGSPANRPTIGEHAPAADALVAPKVTAERVASDAGRAERLPLRARPRVESGGTKPNVDWRERLSAPPQLAIPLEDKSRAEQGVIEVPQKTEGGSTMLPIEKTAGDAAIAIAKAGLLVLPLVGGPVAELLSSVVTPPLEKRRVAWMQQLGERLGRLEAEGRLKLDDLRENDAFIDTVLEATRTALRTGQLEKKEALKNAVLNAALSQAPEESLRQMFIQFVDRFTAWHLRLLKALDNPPAWAQAHSVNYRPAMTSSLSGFLEAAFPELRERRDFYNQVWSEVAAAGLTSTSGLAVMMTETGWQASRTSELGKRFLRFIEDPPPSAPR